ncbi:MAG: AEC family transporter [Chloroflexi bacterium]|nr:AEC family transporter [Chloroflexota bacterium]
MTDLLNVVLPTFIVILIGYLWGKIKKPDMTAIVEMVFYIGLPAIAFTSVIDKKIVLLDASKIWASALIIMFGCGLTAWLVFKIMRQKHSGLYMPILIMNTVNIPFPIIFLVYGAEGLFAATLFYIPNMLALYSIGIYLASGKPWKDSLKDVLRVPALYAAVAGLVVNFGNITVPELIVKPLSFIGLMVIPLVLLIAGYNLSTVRLKSLPTPLLASFLRLGVGLALGFLAVGMFNLTGILKAVVILDSAMPAAVNTAMLATKYKNEAELVSSVVFITTIASLAIIPFLLNMLA